MNKTALPLNNPIAGLFEGMTGFDKKLFFAKRRITPQQRVKRLQQISANLSQKAKSVLSPYFGAKDFAPVYALA